MECEDGGPEIAHRVGWRRGFNGCGVEDAAGVLDRSSDGVGGKRTVALAAHRSYTWVASRHSTYDERGHCATLLQVGCAPSLQFHRDAVNGCSRCQPYTCRNRLSLPGVLAVPR